MSANIRSLIREALDEAFEEFSAIVDRKLEGLFGSERRAPMTQASAKPVVKSTRYRSAKGDVESLRGKVLDLMPTEGWYSRKAIAYACAWPANERTRLSGALNRLKADGLIEMRGTRRLAEYRRIVAPAEGGDE